MKLAIFLIFTIISTSLLAQNSNPRHRPGYCPLVENKSCEATIKSNVPRWDIDEDSEKRSVKYACAGNEDSNCLRKIMVPLARFDKNNLEDLTRLALSCQLTNSACVDYVSNKLSRHDFNSIEDVTQIAMACARSEVSCVKSLCNTRQYNCKRKTDLLSAARSCYQPCK
jgi:hypothetical protein